MFISHEEWIKIQKIIEEEKRNQTFPTPYKEYSHIKNMNKIFPTKQRLVYNIVNEFKNNNIIEKIIIFGSSITDKVKPTSDLDIAIKLNLNNKEFNGKFDEENVILNEIAKTISKITKGNFDLLFLDDKDIYNNKIYDQITKGVEISYV